MNDAEIQMNEIVNYLKSGDMLLSKQSKDGRVNSILNEDEILRIIEQRFNIDVPRARDWADFYIDAIPVNIKVTTTNTADNASSKKGVYYALTGTIYQGNNTWEQYLQSLKENISDSEKDYYFLIINKEDTQDIFFNSLKCITSLVPNGNNLPFQIKWKDNKILQRKTFEEAKALILKTLGKSMQLRADAYLSFQKYFGEYLQ